MFALTLHPEFHWWALLASWDFPSLAAPLIGIDSCSFSKSLSTTAPAPCSSPYISLWIHSLVFTGCLFNVAQSVEHMNEGPDALAAIGQKRRRTGGAERKALTHMWSPWDHSLHQAVTLEFFRETIDNRAKNQTDFWRIVRHTLWVMVNDNTLKEHVPKVVIWIPSTKHTQIAHQPQFEGLFFSPPGDDC